MVSHFSTLTQAATCTCLGRGYTIDGQGDAVACTCEAGAAFAAEFTPAAQAPAATIAVKPAKGTPERQALDLALASEIDRVITEDVAEVVRPCSVASGVTLKRRGRLITVEWFKGRRMLSAEFFVWKGSAWIVSAPPVGWLPSRAAAHIERALAYYAGQTQKAAA